MSARRITVGHSGHDSPLLQWRRFWAKVRIGDGCWEWVGARTGSGYGAIKRDGRMVCAHRVAYELLVGPIPDGLQIDHLCRNTSCVRPDHLEPVTPKENQNRSPLSGAAKTHCPQGHPYDEVNTDFHNGRRHCRACALERRRAKGVKPFRAAQHGTNSKYALGCRCDACRAANRAYNKAYHERRRLEVAR